MLATTYLSGNPPILGDTVRPGVKIVRWGMEGVVLASVTLSPWAFGCVHPLPQLFLAGGLSVLLLLWAMRMILEGRVAWANCPVFFCLAGLFLLGVLQIAPLPGPLLETLSPNTAALRRDLLPSAPEQIVAGEVADPQSAAAGHCISFCPGTSRTELLGWLAILVLFAVVRNNLAGAECLRRLAVVALANGALLALFGMLQFFSSPRQMLYWSLPSNGAVFGPFINRNHFACYINLCIGLGIGLLPSLRPSADAGGPRRQSHPALSGNLQLLLRPQYLGAGLAMALMVAAVALCLSRGALVALLAAGVLSTVLSCWRSRQPPRVWGMALVAAASLGLVAWLGLPAVHARLSTLWRGDALEDGRLELWARVLPLWLDFPLWGAGYGAFPYLEPLTRTPAPSHPVVYDYADNDYVQLLLEGGAVGLLLALGATTLVYWQGGRAYLRLRSTRAAGLLLGALFAWTAVIVQGFFSYELHVPAIAVLATVLAAQLSSARSRAPEKSQSPGPWRRVAAVLGALAAAVLAFVLVREAWCAARAERYRLAAEQCKTSADPAAQERRRTYLHAACDLVPDNVLLQLELAEVYHDAFERHQHPGDMRTALKYFVRARDLCPLLGQPHVRLATHARTMARADTRAAYLRRAARLMPADERIWFACGAQALEEGHPEEAWPCWRRSLLCSPRYLKVVLQKSSPRLAPEDLVHKVLPEDPALLYDAALLLSDNTAARDTLLAAALRLLEEGSGGQSGEACYLRARCQEMLGHSDRAMQAYRDALDRTPEKSMWRYEFIQLLWQRGQLAEARRELLILLQQEPSNDTARELYKKVLARIAEGE